MKLTKDLIQRQDSYQANKDKAPTKLSRKNFGMYGIVQGSLLNLHDKATVISTLMKLTCLAQSHLLLND